MESETDDSLSQKPELIFELWTILHDDKHVMENLVKFIDQHGKEILNLQFFILFT